MFHGRQHAFQTFIITCFSSSLCVTMLAIKIDFCDFNCRPIAEYHYFRWHVISICRHTNAIYSHSTGYVTLRDINLLVSHWVNRSEPC